MCCLASPGVRREYELVASGSPLPVVLVLYHGYFGPNPEPESRRSQRREKAKGKEGE